jgi:hypothetical protein
MPSDLSPDHPPALIAQIMEIVLASPFRTLHYTGGADEGMLRALLADRERLEVTVMDMPDRWETGYAFWYDEREFGGRLPRERPEWLEGVPFYQEGASDHEIALRDWPWESLDQFDRIVAFTGCRPPKLVLLFGQADTAQVGTTRVWNYSAHDVEERDNFEKLTLMHPAYDWETLGDLRVGRWKAGVKSAHEKREARGRGRQRRTAARTRL